MKLKETLLSTQHESIEHSYDEIGDEHVSSSLNTPLRDDAFDISDSKKKEIIANHFKIIMETLGLDLKDDSLMGTPYRVAKMYVDEIFNGLNPKNKPKVALFNNKYQYNEMLVEKNITFYSNCEHHWHHEHFFLKKGDKIEMIDKVSFKVPFGFIGRLLTPIIIIPKLEEIFKFRYNIIKEKFKYE